MLGAGGEHAVRVEELGVEELGMGDEDYFVEG